MYLRRSRRHSLLQVMSSFFQFFFLVALLNLSYRQTKFHTSSAIRFAICKVTVSSSSSFKLNLVVLTVFPHLNLRLEKIKPFTTVCISKFSRFCSHASSLLSYQVCKLRNFVFSFIFTELTSKVADVSAVFLWSQ